jgi:deazaflavin-dependent oxidoreductase (nitroreductase family)
MVSRYRLLQLSLVVVGVAFLFLYPLAQFWPSGWAWHSGPPYKSDYFMMIVGVYATLGVFLINAARNPRAHLSLIWFTVCSSVVHAAIMAVQSVGGGHHMGHLVGDVPALLVVAVVLAMLVLLSGGRQVPDGIMGIPTVDLTARPAWKATMLWWMGGRLVATEPGEKVWRKIAAIEAPIMHASGGRVRLNGGPTVVLTSTGARSGKRRETALAYFTDGADIVLIASNFGGQRHPSWYHNLLAHPECELHIGPRGGQFVAREVDGADRDRLFALAATKLARNYANYAQHIDGVRTIPVMRLTPVTETDQ